MAQIYQTKRQAQRLGVKKSLNDALNMLHAISLGKTFPHSEFMGKVVTMERSLDPDLDTDHGAYIHFSHRPS